MTNEEKQLLLKDICARLPYGVYVLVHDTFEYSTVPYENVYIKSSNISSLIDSISLNERYNSRNKLFNRIIKEHTDFLDVKPYLRPMSSMTEDEVKEFNNLIGYEEHGEWIRCNKLFGSYGLDLCLCSDMINWLNANHFDYRGLIEKGLVLEAPKDMYKTE